MDGILVDILERAQEYVQRGWIQGAFARVSPDKRKVVSSDPHATCFCLVGALERAVIGLTNERREDKIGSYMGVAQHFVKAAIEAETGEHVRFLSIWNDAPWRTQEDVLGALRAAEETAREYIGENA